MAKLFIYVLLKRTPPSFQGGKISRGISWWKGLADLSQADAVGVYPSGPECPPVMGESEEVAEARLNDGLA